MLRKTPGMEGDEETYILLFQTIFQKCCHFVKKLIQYNKLDK